MCVIGDWGVPKCINRNRFAYYIVCSEIFAHSLKYNNIKKVVCQYINSAFEKRFFHFVFRKRAEKVKKVLTFRFRGAIIYEQRKNCGQLYAGMAE